MKSISLLAHSLLFALSGVASAAEPAPKAAAAPAPAASEDQPAAAEEVPASAETPDAAKDDAPTTEEAPAATPAAATPAAATPTQVPPPGAWLKELKGKGALKSRGDSVYPSTILFLEDVPKEGQPVFAKVDAEQFGKLGFLRAPTAKDLDFFFAINKRPTAKDAKISKTRDQWLSILLDATSGDTVLFMHKKGPWEIIQIKAGKPQVILAKPGPGSMDAAAIHQWLISQLGYEGVVLDRKGRHFLVGTLQNVQKADTQALIVKESGDQFTLKAANTDGAGLLQLTSHESGFGVFEMLIGDKPENIPVGTKIMIEKKKGAASADEKPAEAKPTAKKAKKPAASEDTEGGE